mmetsp:Transcript_24187/g.37313  ORF Transcript_24187/g.37313 Transcript_24187/m.37313 type:complete len:234 (-) Transcript_24187:765-1466(-)
MSWLTTTATSFTSSPRAATSVAQRMRNCPALKAFITLVRSHWARSPWRASTAKPSSHNRLARSLQVVFLATNTMTLSWSCFALFESPPSVLLLLLPHNCFKIATSLSHFSASAQTKMCCVISLLATSELTSPTLTWIGSTKKSKANRCISLGHVAENNMVCLCGCVACLRTARICGSNPMSSMRSASSSTTFIMPSREALRISIRSLRRPGVAMIMSTPASSDLICGYLGAPP